MSTKRLITEQSVTYSIDMTFHATVEASFADRAAHRGMLVSSTTCQALFRNEKSECERVGRTDSVHAQS